MAINYDHLMSLKREGDRFKFTDRETMLYALGVGMGRDPLDDAELAYVTERHALKTIPSMATVLTRTNLLTNAGIDRPKVLHGEQRLVLHRPLPPEGELIADSRVTEAYDKGAGKGAVIYSETKVRSATDNQPMYTLLSTTFARGDGGFGGPAGSGPEPHSIPNRKPVLTAVCKYDHTRITGFDVRFSSPVYPGESIATDIWVDGTTVSFRCRVPQRDVVVINNGKCTLAN